MSFRTRNSEPKLVSSPARLEKAHYPTKQVGEIITRQDRRDFTADEVTRALSRLGFTCTPASTQASPTASAALFDTAA